MGLCLSKRDVLIQKPQMSLREQMLSSDLHLRAARHFIPDSPSMASMISGDSSSVAEKHLLKNNSIGSSCPTLLRSSISNIAECGSRSSFGENWRYSSKLQGAVAPSDDEDLDDLSSTCPRTSNFSYISSPMVEGIESYGLENISRSYQRAKERFDMEGFTSFNPRLLEIDEEHEDLEDSDVDSPSRAAATIRRKKTSQPKSLHVFGEGYGSHNNKVQATPSFIKSSKSSELGVFGAYQDHHQTPSGPGMRSVSMRPEPPKVSIFKQPQFDSDFSYTGSELEAEHVHPSGRSARWGFVVDSLGSDEMEGDETTEASRVSSSSTNFESLCRSSISGSFKPAFMAVPKSTSESWQHHQQPSFSHMNPNPKTMSKAEDLKSQATGFLRGFGAPLKPMSFEFVAGSSSSSSDSSSSESSKPKTVKQVHLNSGHSSKKFDIDDDDVDDGNDSDSSNDLFEIENLGVALGSLSSFSSHDVNKEFIYPAMNNSFLKDPDISYSTTTVTSKVPASAPGTKPFPFQSNKGSSGGKVLGPTLRANVLQSSAKQQKGDSQQQRKSFTRPIKKKSALENDTLLFYGR